MNIKTIRLTITMDVTGEYPSGSIPVSERLLQRLQDRIVGALFLEAQTIIGWPVVDQRVIGEIQQVKQ